MIKRDYNANRLNSIVNHADVRPWVLAEDDGELDLQPLLNNVANVALMTDVGGLLFVAQAPMIYEVHTQFLPEAHGSEALEITREALRWMFSRSDAMELWTKVPESNRAALGLVRAIHGRLEFIRPKYFGESDVSHFVLRFPDWAQSDIAVRDLGHWFHEELEKKCEVLGLEEAIHPYDPSHDSAVGATIACFRHSQVDKGLSLYNRWAAFSSYAPISLIARWPLTLDIVSAVIVLSDDAESFEVLAKTKQTQSANGAT